jgi:hypothetical protein
MISSFDLRIRIHIHFIVCLFVFNLRIGIIRPIYYFKTVYYYK